MRHIAAIIGIIVLLAAPAIALAQYDYPPSGPSAPSGPPPAMGDDGGMSDPVVPEVSLPDMGGDDVEVSMPAVPVMNLPVMGGDDGSVTIVDFAFQPHFVSVDAGSTVSWSNTGAAPHTVTSNTGDFDSGTIGSGGDYSETFSDAGLFMYHCTIHPNMSGLVQVSGS